MQAGLYNGGPAAIVYGIILSTVGNLAIACSLAELASLYVYEPLPNGMVLTSSWTGTPLPGLNITGVTSSRLAVADLLVSSKASFLLRYPVFTSIADGIQVGSPYSRGPLLSVSLRILSEPKSRAWWCWRILTMNWSDGAGRCSCGPLLSSQLLSISSGVAFWEELKSLRASCTLSSCPSPLQSS